jgi:hypothetical protein
MIKLKKLLLESDSEAAEQAHHLGLTAAGWGTWRDQSGKTVAKTVQGKLVKLEPGEAAPQQGGGGDAPPKPPAPPVGTGGNDDAPDEESQQSSAKLDKAKSMIAKSIPAFQGSERFLSQLETAEELSNVLEFSRDTYNTKTNQFEIEVDIQGASPSGWDDSFETVTFDSIEEVYPYLSWEKNPQGKRDWKFDESSYLKDRPDASDYY